MTAAAIAGGVVLLSLWLGGYPFIVALLLAVLVGVSLGALLIWGVCSGHGSAAENEAIAAAMWQPEPFTPSRRVVAPGGRVVSTRPIAAPTAAADGRGGPALDSVTLQASRDPALVRPVEMSGTAAFEPVAAPEPEFKPAPGTEVTLPATPSIASVLPVAPVAMMAEVPPGSATYTDPLPASDAEQARAAQTARKAAKARLKADKAAMSAGPAAQDVVLGADRVATLTGAAAGPAPADGNGDALMRIQGIDQMTAIWLRDSGVASLAQIAAWDDADIARFAGMMGRNGHRIRAEDWAGQAARLVAEGHSHG